ncbi:MAG: hypothetical protein K8R48_05775 [Alphaproteobacteria bacterium]|nr:hypothetical protein [Alphaproteobacteria bacterium]
MNSETKRGKAQLRDMSAAQGIYDVDYMVHVNTRTIKNIGVPVVTQKMVTAYVQSINGYVLKNGKYVLEENGESLYQLEKAGTTWRVIS